MVSHNQRCINVEGCGWRDVINVNPGEHPPCPDCGGPTERLWLSGLATFRDDIPGGVVCENYGPEPIKFYSHSERRRYMKEHGLGEREKFCPTPGTDIDPRGIPNPKGYVDAQTLENARILICRNGIATQEDKTEGVLVGFESGHLTDRDAIAIQSGDARRMSRLHRRTSGS